MSDQDMNKIRKVAEGHTINPRPEAWKKLNGKLKAQNTKRRILAYRNISIAAILISVLSVTAVFNFYLGKQHDPGVFTSNESANYKPMKIEDLNAAPMDAIYDLENISELKKAYLTEKAISMRDRILKQKRSSFFQKSLKPRNFFQ